MRNQKETPDLDQLSDIALEHASHGARISKPYVATMSDIVNAMNMTSINDLNGIDLEELRVQTGNLVYFSIKKQQNPTPCDVDYLIRLHSHLRRPLLLLMKKIKKNLNSSHRRVLSSLERDNALEKVILPKKFEIDIRIKTASIEMRRYRKMSELVKGGGRKLDILFQSIKIPARLRSEILILFRIMADRNHPKHVEAIEWLNNSPHNGDFGAFQVHCLSKVELLESQAESIFDMIEDLSGMTLSRDFSEIDLNQSWYTLGQATARGEDFLSSFRTDDQTENKIKRLTFTMVRIGWDSDRLTAEKDAVLIENHGPDKAASLLSKLFFDIQDKISHATGSESDVIVAIESDHEKGLMSEKEYQQAHNWVSANQVKLKGLLLDIYQEICNLKKEHPELVIPEELESAIEQIQSTMNEEKASQKKQLVEDISQLDFKSFETEFEEILFKREDHPESFIKMVREFSQNVIKQKNYLSIKNVELHRRIRESYPSFSDYENKVMELMKIEEGLEEIRIKIEKEVLNFLPKVEFSKLLEVDTSWIVVVHTNHILLSIKKCDFESIKAESFRKEVAEVRNQEKDEIVAHLDYLLQIIQAIPKANQLSNALGDWEKDLSPDELAEKKAFIETNDEALQKLSEKIRDELRENLGKSNFQNRRIRFEVFGFSDYFGPGLDNTFKALMDLAPMASSIKELEQILSSVKALETQVIEAQKATRGKSQAAQKLADLLKKDIIDSNLLHQLETDLDENFHDLNRVLPKISAGLKRLVLMQNRYGADKDSDYLEITINIDDLEKLKELYDFIDEANLEDIKRFCVAYNLRQTLMEDFFEATMRKDVSIPKELQKVFTSKIHKNFKEKRFIPSNLKYQIYLQSNDIFEAEVQLLIHTLNLVKPHRIQNKASFKSLTSIMAGTADAPPWVIKKLGLIWGRTQSRLFKHTPVNHQRNYEGNRTALSNSIKELVGNKFELQL